VGVVTVSRQYGAGGLRVAPALADALGYRFVDREVVEEAARRVGVDPELARDRDERVPDLIEQLGRALAAASPEFGMSFPPVEDRTLADATAEVVRALAAAGGYVILGRGGQAVLRDRPDAFHLSLVGSREDRLARVMKSQGLSERESADRLERTDDERAAYVKRFLGADINDPLLYDCVLNTSRLGIAGAVAAAVAAARHRFGLTA
jgi:cytidylate kinase